MPIIDLSMIIIGWVISEILSYLKNRILLIKKTFTFCVDIPNNISFWREYRKQHLFLIRISTITKLKKNKFHILYGMMYASATRARSHNHLIMDSIDSYLIRKLQGNNPKRWQTRRSLTAVLCSTAPWTIPPASAFPESRVSCLPWGRLWLWSPSWWGWQAPNRRPTQGQHQPRRGKRNLSGVSKLLQFRLITT